MVWLQLSPQEQAAVSEVVHLVSQRRRGHMPPGWVAPSTPTEVMAADPRVWKESPRPMWRGRIGAAHRAIHRRTRRDWRQRRRQQQRDGEAEAGAGPGARGREREAEAATAAGQGQGEMLARGGARPKEPAVGWGALPGRVRDRR